MSYQTTLVQDTSTTKCEQGGAPRLVNIKQLAKVTGFAIPTLRLLYQGRKISYVKLGHRSLWFDPEQVLRDIKKLEVRAR